MEIQILKYLQENPAAYPNDPEYEGRIKPISIPEIEFLETMYNNGIVFPKALRELLYLAGKACYVLDYNIYDNQEELQSEAREWLQKYNRVLNHPFFVIDVYNAGEQFLFVYLNEGDDPIVRQVHLPQGLDSQVVTNLANEKLSQYVKSQINEFKQGYNPF